MRNKRRLEKIEQKLKKEDKEEDDQPIITWKDVIYACKGIQAGKDYDHPSNQEQTPIRRADPLDIIYKDDDEKRKKIRKNL